MLPSNKIIKLGIACFVALLTIVGLVVWDGQSRVGGRIEVVGDTSPDLNEKETDADEEIISAETFLAVLIDKDGTEEILLEKNKDMRMPIASISKLMTALVASGQYRPEEVIVFSENTLNGKGLSGVYHTGDSFYFSDILQTLLVGSHNEVASLLAEKVGTAKFVSIMNQKTRKLGLEETFFVNVTGLDTATSSDKINSSTASDVAELVRYLEESRPDILSVTGQKQFELFDVNKKFVAKIINTNSLVREDDLPFHIIGGKTGETPRAKQSLVTVVIAPCGGRIIGVVLGSQDRFGDMKMLFRQVEDSREWNCGI